MISYLQEENSYFVKALPILTVSTAGPAYGRNVPLHARNQIVSSPCFTSCEAVRILHERP